jgi:hypothetical protein
MINFRQKIMHKNREFTPIVPVPTEGKPLIKHIVVPKSDSNPVTNLGTDTGYITKNNKQYYIGKTIVND